MSDKLRKELLEELEQALNGEDASDKEARLILFLDKLKQPAKKPFVGDEWTPVNDADRFASCKFTPESLDIQEMFKNGYVTQTVEIHKNIRITYRSHRLQDELFLQAWMHEDGDRYTNRPRKEDLVSAVLDAKDEKAKQSAEAEYAKKDAQLVDILMSVTPDAGTIREVSLSIMAINEQKMEEVYIMNAAGVVTPSLDVARRKRKKLLELPSMLFNDIVLHFRAFENRVAGLYGVKTVQDF